MKNILFFAFLTPLAFIQCKTSVENADLSSKHHSTDPFKETMTKSQFFEINGKEGNVIEAKNGTVVIIPDGAFKDEKGNIVTENITIEIAEALTLDEMILSNLTTTSDGNLLETDGMIYFNAMANGENLTINPENPIYIQIPTKEKKAGMMAYQGTRDENGNMNWTDPKPLEDYLAIVDLDLLDFRPYGFKNAVQNHFVIENKTFPTEAYIDSLYYSLSVSDGSELLKELAPTDYNEPYYNQQKKIEGGKYTDDSYRVVLIQDEQIQGDSIAGYCGIDPAIIKVIKSKKFQNTLIATKEFEQRMQVLLHGCHQDILEIYIKNLDKNLWELDEMAAVALGNKPAAEEFKKFAKQRLTNVKSGGKHAKQLSNYYKKQLRKTRNKLEKEKKKLVKSFQKEKKEVEKVAKKYRELLWEREKYRMETYGFIWTDTGWINIDLELDVVAKDTIELKQFEIIVENGKGYDRVYSYVVYRDIKSIYRLNSSDGEHFFVGNKNDRQMWMFKNRGAVLISIGYKGETPYLGVLEYETSVSDLKVKLKESTITKVKQRINAYEDYEKENSIEEDLKFMEYFMAEKKRQEEIRSEINFVQELWRLANPCCFRQEIIIAPDQTW